MIAFLKTNGPLLLLTIVATLFFCFSTGLTALDPRNIDWLMNGDKFTHYFGWAFYRNDPWAFPLGSAPSYGFPAGLNVGITDSAPLYAFFFKILSPFLPETFQYLGFLTLMNMVLMTWAGYYVCARYSSNTILRILSGFFLLLTPAFLNRTQVHIALSSHWILVLAWAWAGLQGKMRAFYALQIFAALTHPYLWAMSGLIFFFHLFKIQSFKVNRAVIQNFAGMVLFSVLFWFVFGTLGNTKMDLHGVSSFVLNLNSFWNSMGVSRFVPTLPFQREGQYEGFSYFGVGGFLLVAFAMLHLISRKAFRWSPETKWTLAFFSGIFLISTAFVFTLNDFVLLDLYKLMRWTGIYTLIGVFYACGRFAWIIQYGVLVLILRYLSGIKPKTAASILFAAVLIQFADLGPLFQSMKISAETDQASRRLLKSPWLNLCYGKAHIYFFPIAPVHVDWVRLAHTCGATTNAAYSAREPKSRESANNEIFQNLLMGKAEDNALYVLSKELYSENQKTIQSLSNLEITETDGLVAILKAAP